MCMQPLGSAAKRATGSAMQGNFGTPHFLSPASDDRFTPDSEHYNHQLCHHKLRKDTRSLAMNMNNFNGTVPLSRSPRHQNNNRSDGNENSIPTPPETPPSKEKYSASVGQRQQNAVTDPVEEAHTGVTFVTTTTNDLCD